MKWTQFICFLTLLLLFSSCYEDPNSKFDSEKWLMDDGFSYYPHYRELMVEDLIETHLYQGAKYDSIAPQLGYTVKVHLQPDNPLIKHYTVKDTYASGMDASITYLKVRLNLEREVVEASVIKY